MTGSTLKHWNNFKLKVLLEGIGVGLVAGIVVVFYRILLNEVSEFRNHILIFLKSHGVEYTFIWFGVLILTALGIGILIQKLPMIKGSGIPQVKGVLLRQLKMEWLKELITKFFAGILTVGLGLSLGREGPSVQLGSEIGLGVSRLLKRHHLEEKYLITSGASAGLAAAFNAPLAGVMFALEELHKNFPPVVMICVMGSSLMADFVSKHFFGLNPVFQFQNVTPLPLKYYGFLVGLGVIAGVMGGLFNYTLLKVQDIYKGMHFVKDIYKPIIPFVMAGLLGLIMPEMLGGGHDLIEKMTPADLMLSTVLIYIIVKFVFTMICYGSGVPGGIFLPLLVIGALIGKLYGLILVEYFHLSASYAVNFIILAMAAYFTAIVKAPITGAVLILEMTSSFQHLLALIVVAMTAYVVADLLHVPAIYDALLEKMLGNGSQNKNTYKRNRKTILEIPVSIGSIFEYKKIKEIQWPGHCLIVGIHRGEKEIIPNGDTQIFQGDRLIVLTDEEEGCEIKPVLLSMGVENLSQALQS